MPPININLTSLAVILWSGMMIVAGSIWVLSSQVRKLADLVEEQGKAARPVAARRPRPTPSEPDMTLPPRRTSLRMIERPASRVN